MAYLFRNIRSRFHYFVSNDHTNLRACQKEIRDIFVLHWKGAVSLFSWNWPITQCPVIGCRYHTEKISVYLKEGNDITCCRGLCRSLLPCIEEIHQHFLTLLQWLYCAHLLLLFNFEYQAYVSVFIIATFKDLRIEDRHNSQGVSDLVLTESEQLWCHL